MRGDVAFLSVLAALVASGALLRYLPRKEQPLPFPQPPVREMIASISAVEAPPAGVADRTPPLPIGAYYVGVYVESIDPALAAQLRLEGGLVVRHVVPGSPAEAAGVQPNDLMLTGAGKPLRVALTLGQVVNQAQENEVEFQCLRAGEPLTVRMVPAKRPAEMWTPPVDTKVAAAPEGAGQWVYLSPAAQQARAKALKDLKLPDDFRLEIVPDSSADSPPPHLTLIVHADGREYACQGLKLDSLPQELRCSVEMVLASRPAIGSQAELGATIDALQRELREARDEVKHLRERIKSPVADRKN